ncbi:hypothetical protein MNV49_004234 [Pseudohyphozyma bogoriensis]|nr:hypothetical protein MNV49_004234 [Pseudohyphozyma bogoriensis]
MLSRIAGRRRAHLAIVSWQRHATTLTESSLEVADPLLLYRSLVARGKVKEDHEQLRALVQMRKLHRRLLDYQPPVRLITLLEALRSSSDPMMAATATNDPPPWPFERSPLSSIGSGLTDDEVEERRLIHALDDKHRSKALVEVLKSDSSLEALDTPRGFLLTGPPGTGKSMLLDIFFASLPVNAKIRFHYHHFLLSLYTKVHDALEKQRLEFEAEEKAMNEAAGLGEEGYPWSRREEMKALAITKGWRAVFAGGRSPNDPDLNVQEFVLVGIARDLIKEHGWLLAFDEVQLVDIAGAGMINRVLSWYWRLGGVVIGTSNRVPEDLYNSGVQRESVNAFLVALASRSPVIELNSPLDYRREEQRGEALEDSSDAPGEFGTVNAWKRWGSAARAWFVKGEEGEFGEAVKRIVGEEKGEKRTLKVYGRDLKIPWAVGGVAKFSFHELCEKALGPADYITLASNFHTVILTDVPVLMLSAKNEARRFITLLDSLYEAKTRLLVSAEVGVDDLFFPDAIHGATSPSLIAHSSPDDIDLRPIHDSDSSALPAHSAFRSGGSDAAGEIGDSLVEEMMSEVNQDLEAPYRPNISSYDETSLTKIYEMDQARKVEKEEEGKGKWKQQERKYETPHPSAATKSFQSLAIFTGEEERFAFKRAVSRVHEMSSQEFLRTAEWSPLPQGFRTWERPPKSQAVAPKPVTPARHSMGPAVPLDNDKLSGVLDPSNIRLRFPEGVPKDADTEVNVSRSQEVGRSEPPKLKEEHVWGVREDWGKKSGEWGKGASVYEKGGSKERKE